MLLIAKDNSTEFVSSGLVKVNLEKAAQIHNYELLLKFLPLTHHHMQPFLGRHFGFHIFGLLGNCTLGIRI